jgi:hypothetical protein
MVSCATQAMRYRRMTGDARFREHEQAALDWLFGTNAWGTSMMIGIPRDGVYPRDPHTEMSDSLAHGLTGGLVDGAASLAYLLSTRDPAARGARVRPVNNWRADVGAAYQSPRRHPGNGGGRGG